MTSQVGWQSASAAWVPLPLSMSALSEAQQSAHGQKLKTGQELMGGP